MPTTDQLRAKLIEKLLELFQLDQPELDFGFYRIMHAKAEQVQRFLENDLLTEVQQAFADGGEAKRNEAKAKLDAAIERAKGDYPDRDPNEARSVKDAQAAYEAALDTTKAEAEVYDHLYRFFERYYEDGDFVSRRYLTRETAGKAAPYAVPYDGQEVMLHWANRDQYYIKTSEHFDNYTFEAREAARQLREATKRNKDQSALELGDDLLQGEPLRVHFRIVDAAEGEHNNVKESDKRYFIVDATEPLAFTEAGELLCRFTFRPDPEKSGQDGTWRQKRNALNEAKLLEALKALAKSDKRAEPYLALLGIKAPTGKQTDRTLLGKYIEKYSATNSKDYFIHKDLGGFLRRELDFYLKNEVMRLDDLEGAEAPRVEHYLAKLKVIRRIAHKLIDFLAQLENFQKRLWLKKKFVVETNWCITLDRVPEALYPAIAANPRIKAEWEKLFHIQDLPGYEAKKPLTVDFLKANPYLVLDTAFLSDADKAALLNSIDDLEGQTNGLLVHSENFQALQFLYNRLREDVGSIFIDPPYNTTEESFVYKNNYKHGSWMTMMSNRLLVAKDLMKEEAVLGVSIDDEEAYNLQKLACDVFPISIGTLVVQNNPRGRTRDTYFATCHEYVLFYTNTTQGRIFNLDLTEEQEGAFNLEDEKGQYRLLPFRRSGGLSTPEERPNSEYPIFYSPLSGKIDIEDFPGAIRIMPIDSLGKRRVWRQTRPSLMVAVRAGDMVIKENGDTYTVMMKDRLKEGRKPKTIWTDSKYDASTHGTIMIKKLFGEKDIFSYPKSVWTTADILRVMLGNDFQGHVLDFFAGSATTGHAIVEINREDEGARKYVLVEMGDYFDVVTKPRMQKVVYSRTWKDGKPEDRDGISHCFKYIRLESYEDTLNALELRSDEEREKLLAANKGLREDYTLRYMLDVETKDSASLLNHTAFVDPRAYTLNVKRPGSEERTTKTVDLLETFNYLLGLRVQHMATPEAFTAQFERVVEEDVPKDSPQRLVVKGNLKPVENGKWWFRKVQGWMPRDRHKPHGERDKVLIIWRTLTGDLEQDNAVLDTYFTKNRVEIRDREYDVIYVNGSNNLPNLLQAGDRWKVRLIEEDFHRLMWEGAE